MVEVMYIDIYSVVSADLQQKHIVLIFKRYENSVLCESGAAL